jgi:hypothetical protein
LSAAKWPSAANCVPCWPGSAPSFWVSLLNACAAIGMELVRRAPGCDMCQAQRFQVAGPSGFAMPRSSPADQGGFGTAARCSLSGSAA